MTIPPFAITAFLTSLSTLSLALFVFLRNRKSQINKIFFFYSLSIAEWSFFAGLHATPTSETVSFFSAKASHLGVPLIPILFLHFSLEILGLYEKHKRKLFAGYIACIVLIIANFTSPLIVLRVVPKLSYSYFMDGGFLYPALITYFVGYTILGLWFLLRAYIGSSGNKRNQLKYLFWGSVLGYIFGSSCFLPVYNITIFPYPYGSFAIVIYVFMTAYAIFKYRLMDIRVMAIRTLLFAIVYIPILTIPFAVGINLKNFLENIFHDNWWVAPTLCSTILAPLGLYVYLHIKNRAEAVLLKEQRRYQHTLLQLSYGMTLVKELDKLLQLIVHDVSRAVKIKNASIFLKDKVDNKYILRAVRHQKQMPEGLEFKADEPIIKYLITNKSPLILEEIRSRLHADGQSGLPDYKIIISTMEQARITIVVPLLVRDFLIGFLGLDEKSNGQMYTQDDLNVFVVLANQSALAIENGIFYQEKGRDIADELQEQKLRYLGTMASNICHEVNNHFNGIALESFDLVDSALPALKQNLSSHANLDSINEILKRIEKSINLISHHAQGGGQYAERVRRRARKNIAIEPIDILTSLEFSKSLVRYSKEKAEDVAKNIPMEELGLCVDIPLDFPKVMSDSFTLEQAFANILSNSYYAQIEKKGQVEKGKIQIDNYAPKVNISAKISGSEALVIVTDNGIGMTADQVNQVFAPYFTTKTKSGTGLGLSSIKQALEQQDCKISVESEYGKSTTFTITLPLAKEGGK